MLLCNSSSARATHIQALLFSLIDYCDDERGQEQEEGCVAARFALPARHFHTATAFAFCRLSCLQVPTLPSAVPYICYGEYCPRTARARAALHLLCHFTTHTRTLGMLVWFLFAHGTDALAGRTRREYQIIPAAEHNL